MNNRKIKDVLTDLMGDMSANSLWEATGVPQTTISRILNGETTDPRDSTIKPLADYFRVSIAQLRGYEPISSGIATREAHGNYVTLAPAPPVKRMVPLISWVQAGDWCNVADPYPVGQGECMVPLHGKGGPHTYALRVRGSSMEPEFWDGELIYIDPDAEYRHKSFVVVRLEDRQEATFKQLIDESGKWYLKPLNPDWPEKIIEVGERASICGVVVGKYKEY